MAIVPPNDPSRASKLPVLDDWLGQFGRSFSDVWTNFLEHEARIRALEQSSPGFRVSVAGAAAFAGVAPGLSWLVTVPVGAASLGGQQVGRSP